MRRSTDQPNHMWMRGLLALILMVGLPAIPVLGPSPPPAAAQTKLLNLNFVEADIVDVVKALATQSGQNVVVSGSTAGKKITISLSGVTLEGALRLVTQPNGLDYRRVDDSYVIGSPAELAGIDQGRPGVTRMYTFSNLVLEQANAILQNSTPGIQASGSPGSKVFLLSGPSPETVEQAAAILRQIDAQPAEQTTKVVQLKHVGTEGVVKMLAAHAPLVSVELGPASGTLLLHGLSPDVALAQALIKDADAAPGPGMTTFQVYEIRYGEPEELQQTVQTMVPDVQVILGPRSGTPTLVDPTASTGATGFLKGPTVTTGGSGGGVGGTGSSKVETSPVTTLILGGPPDAIQRALDLLAQIDVAPQLISIAVLIAEGNVSDISRQGIDWIGLGENAPSTTLTEASPIDPLTGAPSGIADNFWKIGRIDRTVFNINATLRALINTDKLHVLSRPNIAVLNGRQATLHSGQTVYYKKQIGIDDRGFPIFDIEQIPTGVTLSINPRLGPDGDIVLTLQPIVSTISENPFFTDLPLVVEHRTLTSVRIKQGEVLVIAGLMRDSDEVVRSKVPLLGDLPIIGTMFRHTTKRKLSSEVMIFIEPVPVQYPTDVDVTKPTKEAE
jgi:general secretion pathway protein D